MESGGLALGVIDDFPYTQETVAMASGDVIVIYSDGVTDATNLSDEPYGSGAARRRGGRTSRRARIDHRRSHRRGGARRTAKGAPQLDDITVVVVKRMG